MPQYLHHPEIEHPLKMYFMLIYNVFEAILRIAHPMTPGVNMVFEVEIVYMLWNICQQFCKRIQF